MDERKAQRLLESYYIGRRNHALVITNVYFPYHEADFLTVDKNDYLTEVEIKVSKWDYLNDFKKEEKHEKMRSKKDLSQIPNYFYYAVPVDLEQEVMETLGVPDYAGLIILGTGGCYIKKKCKRLHNERMDPNQWRDIAIKFYYKLR